MGAAATAAMLNYMSPDDRTLFLSELPKTSRKELVALLSPEESAEAAELLAYAPGAIGRLMTPHYIAVREQSTVREVLDFVREHGQDSETLNVIYVIDAKGVLIDDIRIREFLLVSLDKRVSELMDRHFVTLHTEDHQEGALAVFRREDRTALPVVDDAGVLVGIVTIDDVLDVAADAATREMQQFGGFGGSRRALHARIARRHDQEARGLAGGAVSRRDADRHGDGLLRKRNRQGRRPCAVRAADHLERRQLGVAGVDARHPRACRRRRRPARFLARHPSRSDGRPGAREHPRLRSAFSGFQSGLPSPTCMARTGCWWR